jgi:NADP-dependent 3-hydroxy acid dehydrogenase YdfG
MTGPLQDHTVLVIGRGSGIAHAVATAARDAGAHVVAAGRSTDALAAAYADEHRITTDYVDVTDDASISAGVERGRRCGRPASRPPR